MTEVGPPLAPGETLGVLGGGQLGRMIAIAAAKLGVDVCVFDPDPDAPAARVSASSVAADFEDASALSSFAARCKVVTCEFENVPAAVLAALAAAGARVAPGPASFATAQDRLVEKAFFRDLGAATAPFHPVRDRQEARRAAAALRGPGILKTAREGYDGKGQIRVRTADEVETAFDALGGAPCVLEERVDFVREFSVILARWEDGRTAVYDLAENRHEGGVLVESRAPAAVSLPAADEARRIALAAAEALGHVGVMAVEFFESADGRAIVNEMAPRVHNSGHWTVEACRCGQFEMHVRACCAWPPGDPTSHGRVIMRNLLGDPTNDWRRLIADKDISLTLYGKRHGGDRRKMGHYVTTW